VENLFYRKGFTLLELLLTLTLHLAISFIILHSLKPLHIFGVKAHRLSEITYQKKRLQGILHHISLVTANVLGGLLIKIHPPGIIEFNRQPLLLKTFTPKEGSEAITYAQVSFEKSYAVDSSTIKGDEVSFTVTPIFKGTFSSYEDRFLALSLDGAFEMLSSEEVLLNQDTHSLSLKPSESMLFEKPENLSFYTQIRVLLPITEYLTLYLSKNGNFLRALNHRGENIIENQPVLSSLEKFNLFYDVTKNLNTLELVAKSVHSLKEFNLMSPLRFNKTLPLTVVLGLVPP
jgi:hypothetical protein